MTLPNVTEATYAQGMNLQTNIYTAVLAFGLAESIMADGAFMLAAGIAFIVVAVVLFKLAKTLDSRRLIIVNRHIFCYTTDMK